MLAQPEPQAVLLVIQIGRAVANSLKILSRAFAGVVDEEKVELYRVALDDLTDDELAASVVSLVRGHTGEWLPNPATIRRAGQLEIVRDGGTTFRARFPVEVME